MAIFKGKKIRVKVANVYPGRNGRMICADNKFFRVPVRCFPQEIHIGDWLTLEVRSLKPRSGNYMVSGARRGRQPGKPRVAEDDKDDRKKKGGAS